MSQRSSAMSLTILPAEIRDLSVIVKESNPPQFALHGVRDMPTPGWSFIVDRVEVDTREGRILVKITDVGPQGIVPQVITPTKIEMHLGKLRVGRYCVEVRTRRERRQRYVLLQSFAVEASREASS